MTLKSGVRLGLYEIHSAIGAGGMGEVWRARDTTLGRDVALKILPDHLALDPDRLARFKREAQILASLNHPNIATIHGFQESDGVQALVLELVEGPTLADQIAAGPIPIDEALTIAKQIAEALEAAHEQGIIHRDLKPANIKLRPYGTVKVLDFGLAKVIEPTGAVAPSGLSMSPTITSPAATHVGMILGTAAYMSPEQARGKPVDKRADIWAFGCVLYEMLTGQRVFEDDDVSLTLSKVLQREPDFDALPREVPARVRQALRVCLRKDPKQRIGDIRDVRLAIEGAFETTVRHASDVATVSRPVGWRRATPWVASVILGGVVAGIGVRALMTQPARPVTRFVADTAGTELFRPGNLQRGLTISPDGARIVYRAGGGHLYVRAMNQLEGVSLLPTVTPIDNPFFAPDGSWIGFATSSDGTWKKVSILGGPPVTLWKVGGRGGPRGASWGQDGTIIFTGGADGTGLFRGPAAGGEPEVLTTPDAERGESVHWWPEILPGDRAVLFTILMGGLTAGDTEIAVLELSTGERKTLISGGSNPQYAPTGHIVYGTAGTLRAVPFDLDRLEVTGDPVPVLDGVLTHPSGAVEFDISADGSLVYVAGAAADAARTLVWVNREGREETIAAPPRAYTSPHLSPNSTKAAFDVRDREQDIWIWDFSRQNLTRLTLDAARERAPIWIDDRRVAFESEREGNLRLYSQAADGTGVPERIGDVEHERGQIFQPKSVSPDGKWLVVTYPTPPTRTIGLIDLMGNRQLKPLIEPGFIKDQPAVSPDGRWISYQSNETGRNEIYVRPFPAIDRRWTVSTNGGDRAVWSRDGGELFYIEPPGRLMAVRIEPGAEFSARRPQLLFEAQYAAPAGRSYDVASDGRFLMMKVSESESPTASVIVVQNWLEELKRLVPTN